MECAISMLTERHTFVYSAVMSAPRHLRMLISGEYLPHHSTYSLRQIQADQLSAVSDEAFPDLSYSGHENSQTVYILAYRMCASK